MKMSLSNLMEFEKDLPTHLRQPNQLIPGALYALRNQAEACFGLYFLSPANPNIHMFEDGAIFIFLGVDQPDNPRNKQEKIYDLLGPDGQPYFVVMFDPGPSASSHPIFAESTTWKEGTFNHYFERVSPTAAVSNNEAE